MPTIGNLCEKAAISLSPVNKFTNPWELGILLAATANAAIASPANFDLSTAALSNEPKLVMNFFKKYPTIGNLKANIEISLSPVNNETSPPELGILLAATANAAIDSPAFLITSTDSGVNPCNDLAIAAKHRPVDGNW